MADKSNAIATRDTADLKKQLEHYKNEQAMILFDEDELKPRRFVRPVLSRVFASPDDFHKIPGGQIMPKSHQTHAISDACGISFTENGGVRKEGEGVWVGWAQGKKRGPDGTVVTSPIMEYEFDANVRAEEEFLRNPDKYKTDLAKKKRLLELKKFGRQMASTGAELRVIRRLANIPVTFTPQQFAQGRAMIFKRYEINTDEMMDNAEMRQQFAKLATSGSAELYGSQEPHAERTVSGQIEAPEEPESGQSEADIAFGDDPEQADAQPDAVDGELLKLEEWLGSDQLTDRERDLVAKAFDAPKSQARIDLVNTVLKTKNMTARSWDYVAGVVADEKSDDKLLAETLTTVSSWANEKPESRTKKGKAV